MILSALIATGWLASIGFDNNGLETVGDSFDNRETFCFLSLLTKIHRSSYLSDLDNYVALSVLEFLRTYVWSYALAGARAEILSGRLFHTLACVEVLLQIAAGLIKQLVASSLMSLIVATVRSHHCVSHSPRPRLH